MKKKILIVDDDPTSLRTVEGVLKLHGYEIKGVAHAEDIEHNIKEFNPDLIVMDLLMPKVAGNQAVEQLQKNPALKDIPVVFITALQMKDEDRGLELEVSVANRSYRTLSKPLDAKALVASIRELTNQI